MRKKRATERFALKVLAFLVTVLTFVGAVVCIGAVVIMAAESFYTTPLADLVKLFLVRGGDWGVWKWFYYNRFTVMIWGILCILLCILSFVFLMCSAGKVYLREKVEAKGLNAVPFDLLTGVMVLLGFLVSAVLRELSYNFWTFGVAAISLGIVYFCVFLGYCIVWAIQSKAGIWWKNTLICRILRMLAGVIRFCFVAVRAVLRNLPLLVTAGIGLVAFYLAELLLLILWGADAQDFVALWLIEQVSLIPVVLYFALVFGKLLKGSEALVNGYLSSKVDTKYMLGSFKEQGENLNSIAQGLNVVIEERMKSERMKTELITNVSHDIKTPLTSIINYADLIVEEPTDNEKITEYAEVLKRQSARLKKLIEDLMEASKASTGNIEVNMQPCEVDVLLTQTMGEYEQRLAELQLELIVRQPQQSVKIMADGKLLWRVFDNLLNNICKYAMPGTRVYLTVQEIGDTVAIAFKNISRYPLEISADELQERFVRGDRSRHTEGNGLGLSIAQSLTDLQEGRLELTVDGDFFKAMLYFVKVAEE